MKRIKAIEIIPTITIHIKFLVKMAVKIVGNEASKFSMLTVGKSLVRVIKRL